jgi:hypothetical protein
MHCFWLGLNGKIIFHGNITGVPKTQNFLSVAEQGILFTQPLVWSVGPSINQLAVSLSVC